MDGQPGDYIAPLNFFKEQRGINVVMLLNLHCMIHLFSHMTKAMQVTICDMQHGTHNQLQDLNNRDFGGKALLGHH